MSQTRRHALISLVAVPSLVAAAEAEPRPKETEPFFGSWFVTSAVTSLILSIEPHGEALFVFIENGVFSIVRTTWKPLPGGVLVEGFPRIRLWHGPQPESIRAEMEPLPKDIEVSPGFRYFPPRFLMRRAAMARLAGNLPGRPLPKGWEKDAPDEDWDAAAGRRRGEQAPSPEAD